MSLLIAGIVDNRAEVSVSFTSMMMRLQQHLVMTPNAPRVIFEFFVTSKDALEYAISKGEEVSHAVIIHGDMGLVDLGFIFKPFASDVCVAAYPTRHVNWQRVLELKKQGIRDPAVLEKQSYEYNFDRRHATSVVGDDGTVQIVEGTISSQAKIVKVSRDGLKTFMKSYDPVTHMYTGPCSIDVSTSVTNSGPYDFSGSLMNSNIVKS